MKKLSFLNKVIFIINNIFALLLLFSFFIPNITPSSISPISIVSLLTPAIIVINICFLLYWILIGFKKQLFLSALILILGYFIAPPLYKFSSTQNEEKTENQLSILSYNVRKFNMYNWIEDANISLKISDFIKKENPDIVTLQEFKKDKDFKLDYPFQYNHINYNWNKTYSYPSGLAFFSKYPIINTGVVKYRNVYSSIVFVDILKKTDTIRVYNAHLESLGIIPSKEYFGHKDSEGLIKALSKSFEVQQTEIDSLRNHLKNCNHKLVVTGDMNNTAYSWVYKNLKNDLKDSFLEAGKGFGKTYDFKGFPLRIDYIFTDPSLKVIEHKNYNIKYSDHYPISATVSF